MIRLHISREVYTTLDAMQYPIQVREPHPACGANDGRGIIKRGTWYGYLHRAAMNREFHCSECCDALDHADWREETR